MKQSRLVEETIRRRRQNELILAGRLFREELADSVSEEAFYKTLERMCKCGELARLAKGTYYLPKKSLFGMVPLPEREIISAFTKGGKGTVIGYALYNRLGLTTQIAKTTEILSCSLDTQTRTIRNVIVRHSPLLFTKAVEEMVHALDVLQNVAAIQDLNHAALLAYSQKIAEGFQESVFEEVIEKQRFSKSTIAFLQEILNYFGKKHSLKTHLSTLSTYKYPKMEELYAAAQVSRRV